MKRALETKVVEDDTYEAESEGASGDPDEELDLGEEDTDSESDSSDDEAEEDDDFICDESELPPELVAEERECLEKWAAESKNAMQYFVNLSRDKVARADGKVSKSEEKVQAATPVGCSLQ